MPPAQLPYLLDRLESVPEGGWYRANENRFDAVWTPPELRPLVGAANPVPGKIVSAWSGFAWDCRRGDLLLYGGGHANYSGNDVYRWRGSTRTWERLSLPSQVTLGASKNYEAVDGPYAAPSSAHTYDNNIFLPHADRLMAFGGAAYNNGGPYLLRTGATTSRPTGPYLFDPKKADPNKVGGTTGSHVKRVGPYPNILGGMMWENRDIYEFADSIAPRKFVNGATAYVSEGGKDVVLVNGAQSGSAQNLYRYVISDVTDPLSDTIEQVGRYKESFSGGGAGAYDPEMRLFVRTAAYSTTAKFTYWDLNTPGPTNGNVNFAPTDLTGGFQLSQVHGMDFDPVRRQYVLWAGGGTVWLLKPPAQPSRTGWTIRAASAASATVPAAFAEQGGVFGKWQYVAELDAFVGLQDQNAGNVWIYKPVGWKRPPAPSGAPVVTLTATPITIDAGANASLGWSASNATSCTATGGWSGDKSTSGSQTVGPLLATTVFSLSCTGPEGLGESSVTVTVNVPQPVLNLVAEPFEVASGDTSNLVWTSSGVSSCAASGGWSGAKPVNGSETVGPVSADVSYTLSCTGLGGTVLKTVAVTVVTPPPPSEPVISSFSAEPARIQPGESSVLSWSTSGVTSCTASGGWTGTKATSGSQSVGPLMQTTNFTLTCTGDGVSVNRTLTVNVGSSVAATCPVGTTGDLGYLLDRLGSVPEGGWYRANENRFDAVWTPPELRPLVGAANPVPGKIISAWSGFAWDCRRGDLLLYGGGHANYSGNDVYRWRGSTRTWERLSLPSQVTPGVSNNYEAVDGPYAAPSSAHTYDNNIFLPHADRLMAFGGAAYNNGGPYLLRTGATTSRPTGPYLFDPKKADPNKVGGTTGSHVKRVGPYPNILGGMMWENRDIYEFADSIAPRKFVNGATAYVSEGGKDVVLVNGAQSGSAQNLYRYVISDVTDPLSDTIEQVGRYKESFSGGGAGAYDPEMRLFVRTAAYSTTAKFTYWDLNTPGPTNGNVNFAPTDLTGGFQLSQVHGMDFDPVRRQYVLWAGGGTVWLLKPPAQPSRTGWTIRAASAASATVPAAFAEQGGVFGKWKYVAELDAFVGLQDQNAGNVWIYKPVGWKRPD
jgi:hypothetical protein